MFRLGRFTCICVFDYTWNWKADELTWHMKATSHMIVRNWFCWSPSHDPTQPPPYSCLSWKRLIVQSRAASPQLHGRFLCRFIRVFCFGSLKTCFLIVCRVNRRLWVEFLSLTMSVKMLQTYSVRRRPAAPPTSPTESHLMMTTTCLLVGTLLVSYPA